MKQLKWFLFVALVLLTSCSGNGISEDPKVIGKVEQEAFRFILDKLTKDMKQHFRGNEFESVKITPEETNDAVKIGIPDATSYTFFKDNSKFVKGDLNGDKKTDLIICADMSVAYGPASKKYFVFLQDEKGYQLYTELQADEMVASTCSKRKLQHGLFKLESVSGGLLVGSSKFHGGDEEYFRDYSYGCESEKYKLNLNTKQAELVFQSPLLKTEENGMKTLVDSIK